MFSSVFIIIYMYNHLFVVSTLVLNGWVLSAKRKYNIVSYNFTFFLFLLTIKWNSEIVPPDGHSFGVTAPVVKDKKLTVNSKIYQINLRLTISSRVLSNLWKIKYWKLYGAVKLLFFPELGYEIRFSKRTGPPSLHRLKFPSCC